MPLLCIVLNFSVSKLPSLPLYSTFICTPCMHFASVHSWWLQFKSHLELGVLQQLKLLYQRDGKFWYPRYTQRHCPTSSVRYSSHMSTRRS